MTGVDHKGERIFGYAFDPVRIKETTLDSIEVFAEATLADIDNRAFLELCATRGLRAGMRVYAGHSRSPVLSEFRATAVTGGAAADRIRVKFVLPRSLFLDQQCRLVQIDLLYEDKVWFGDVIGPPPFTPMWIDRPAKEIDVFEYYRQKHAVT